MDRITPEQVVAAYKATGLTPKRNEWFCYRTNSACGMGAISVQAQGKEEADARGTFHWIADRYDADYRQGFESGFDGDKRETFDWLSPARRANRNLGYDDGQAAAEAVFDVHFRL
jgi:hypothetical protein